LKNLKSIKPVKKTKPKTDSDYAFMPICQQATLIKEGTLFPDQLIDIYLSRIKKYNSKLNALIEVYAEDARVLGKCATIEAKNGFFRGPLHGIPIVIKDLIDIKCRQTTLGSMTHIGRTASITATLVKRLQKEGMLIIGKTHTVEFAFGGWGTNHYMGTPFNPWDDKSHRVPGGSSSGSAVAVSAGLASAGIGTDTGGSVRIPASMCGIVGLKPTYGRISTAGVSPLSPTFDSVGPITRCVEDAALLYSLMEGPDTDDPETIDLPHMDALSSLKMGIEGYQLAVCQRRYRNTLILAG
jgi:aspartyl-tRNA(Asn)/glutamyl-tRNA(Gln) amidotransferase subunit A